MSIINFGQFIAIKREQLKLIQSEAARRIGTGPTSLARWESGYIPSKSSLIKLAKAYGMQLSELEAFIPLEKDSKPKQRINIKIILTDIKALMTVIEEEMEAQSKFERNIKNLAINNLLKAEELLKEIVIVDEAF